MTYKKFETNVISMKTNNTKKGENVKVEFSSNDRGMVTGEIGRKKRGEDKFFVKLTDDQNRVYETKTAYEVSTIKKYFSKGQYRIFVRNMKTGETNIKRIG